MQVQKIGTRNLLITQDTGEGWNLNNQIILGNRYDFVIDSGLGNVDGEFIRSQTTKDIILVMSHYHWDHVWGNGVFKDCPIIAHANCGNLLDKEWINMHTKSGRFVKGSVELVMPTLTFEKRLVFEDEGVELIYTPGHTIDSISIYDRRDKILNVVDNIGDDMDEIMPGIYSTVDDYIESLEIYNSLEVSKVISGHNQILDKDIFEIIKRNL